MSRKTLFSLCMVILIIITACTLVGVTAYYSDLPKRISQHETIVLGQDHMVPGSQTGLRVVVRDSRDASPLASARVRLSLKPEADQPAIELYSGVTDQKGTVDIFFRVPEDRIGNQMLVIETSSELGSDTVERAVTIERDYRILLTSDKPIYQPGQIIHVRCLALGSFDLIPASGQDLEVIIADGKGNKVFRKSVPTSQYGVAGVDFQLANEVNTGAYKITAVLGKTSSEKTVTVEHYVLPKFSVKLDTERSYYLPGQHVVGSLSANYFFGKPVGEGTVLLEGYTFDVERNTVFQIDGFTDENGDFPFAFDLPNYIAGSDLEGGRGRFYLQATVKDQAEHSETTNLSLPVAQSALIIEAIPEGGTFRPNVENILYVLTSYPDGTPAESSLEINLYNESRQLSVKTGPYGLAEVRFIPAYPYTSLKISARDVQGNEAEQEFYFEGDYTEESILLRPNHPVYRVGDTMNLTILTSQPEGTVYLDIVREGQTVSTRSVEVDGGQSNVAIDLTPDLYGTLELHAYKILSWGSITRDTRLVVVDNADNLNITMTPGQEVYRPGDTAGLDIQVNGQDGSGIQSALGLAIVDESVFALAEQDPGFAKLYFLLEQQILQPKYDLHGYSILELVTGIPASAEPAVAAIENAAQASLASAVLETAGAGILPFSLQVNSHQDALQRVNERQLMYFNGLSKFLFIAFILLSLCIVGLSLYALAREKHLGRGFTLALVLAVLPILLLLAWPLGENYLWVRTPLDRLSIIFNWIGGQGGILMLSLALLGIIGYMTLIFIAWRRKDSILGWSLGLLPLFDILLFSLIYIAMRARLYPSEVVIGFGLFAFIMVPFAYLLRFAGFTWRKLPIPATAALLMSSFLMFGSLPILATGGMSAMAPMPAADLRNAGGQMLMEEALAIAPPAEMPMPAEAPGMAVEKPADADKTTTTSTAEPPRLRQYFPETMLWLPDPVTDQNGSLHLEFQVADSITTWRVSALASSQDGRIGSLTGGLRVFQDFFIDLDLPLAMTVGDEFSLPIGIFNYLEEEQVIHLELEQGDWFELMDDPVKEVNIAANDISVIYFRIRAQQFGMHPFKVTAIGSKMSDAIQKDVRVYPNGKQILFSQSDRLAANAPVQVPVAIPSDVIAGTQTLLVKIYPGILSQVVEGLDSILRMPFGCFEQTSSTTYPNVLVIDYLKTTNQASPEVQFKAEEYISLGYQRLTTFEVGGSGGFSLFGDAPADRMLTAYGLQEFADMSRVHDVDPTLIRRAADWLLAQQASDGAWENDRGLVHENTWADLGNDRLPVTAYIVWSLVDAGFADESGTQRGLAYIRENQAQAEDTYVLALMANALAVADLSKGSEITPATESVLDRLAGQARQDGSGAFWQSGVATFMGGEGQTGSIETTALAALAFLRADRHSDLANAALTYLVRQKDSFGTWYSTQATVLSLKALIQSVRAGAEKVDANVTITLNGGQKRTLPITPENFDVVQLLSYDDILVGAENVVGITAEGEGNLMYQVSGSYYLPWDKLVMYPDLLAGKDLVTIDVVYDRAELAVNDTVQVDVTVTLNQTGGKSESALIDLGLPPGFILETEDLAALVVRFDDVPEDYVNPKIERYELTGRQILVYASNLSAEYPLKFTYRLRAKFPLVAQTPASNAYDYYNPEVSGETQPQTLIVLP